MRRGHQRKRVRLGCTRTSEHTAPHPRCPTRPREHRRGGPRGRPRSQPSEGTAASGQRHSDGESQERQHLGLRFKGALSGGRAVCLRGAFGHASGQGLRPQSGVAQPCRPHGVGQQRAGGGGPRGRVRQPSACDHVTEAPSGSPCTATPRASQSLWVGTGRRALQPRGRSELPPLRARAWRRPVPEGSRRPASRKPVSV